MARKTNCKPRRDLYQEVTDQIIDQLEAGCVPWVQPWASRGEIGGTALGLPENAQTGRTYSGINILLLWAAAIEGGHAKQSWVTFKQALTLGGNVRKGERGTTVVYADTFTPKDAKETAETEGRDPARIGFLKRYTVFNISQCEGLGEEVHTLAAPMPERESIPHAESLIKATGADFRIGGGPNPNTIGSSAGWDAFYVPSEDYIQVPPQQAYFEQINWFRTCFHELGHWTKHGSRLDRDLRLPNGSRDVPLEELVAEISSAFVLATLKIKPTVRHADYIGSWLEAMRGDKRAIFKAASIASKAADFILAFQAADKPADAA